MLPPHFLTIPQIQQERHTISKLFYLVTLLEYLLKLYNPNITAAEEGRDPKVGERVLANQHLFNNFTRVLWSLKVRNSFAHVIEGNSFSARDQQNAVDCLIEAIGDVCEQVAIPRDIVQAVYHDPDANLKEPKLRLGVFLCHSSADKQKVRNLYSRLQADGVRPWLDEKDLLPGQDWHKEITKAVRSSDVVIVCLSKGSITKEGYIQKEIKMALDVADEKPEDTIYIIPLRLEDCRSPDKLSRWHRVNLYEEDGYRRLMMSLHIRAEEIGAMLPKIPLPSPS